MDKPAKVTTHLETVVSLNLRFFRELRGFTQSELAEKARISQHFVAMIEISRRFPSPDTIEKLCKALSIEPFQLFIDRNSPETFRQSDFAHLLEAGLVESLAKAVAEATRTYLGRSTNK